MRETAFSPATEGDTKDGDGQRSGALSGTAGYLKTAYSNPPACVDQLGLVLKESPGWGKHYLQVT